jgi:exonuclease VII small subunit
MLMKQNASMAKLEKELQRAERRLAKLYSADGVPDPRLEEMLDAERKTMEGAQERTDILMKKLQEGSFSSTLTEE